MCAFWKVYFRSTVQGVSGYCKQYEEETAGDRNECYNVRLPSCTWEPSAIMPEICRKLWVLFQYVKFHTAYLAQQILMTLKVLQKEIGGKFCVVVRCHSRFEAFLWEMLNCVCTLCKHVTLLVYDETFHQIRPVLNVIGTAVMLRWLKQLLFLNASNLTGLCCESFESISQVCFKNDGNDLN